MNRVAKGLEARTVAQRRVGSCPGYVTEEILG